MRSSRSPRPRERAQLANTQEAAALSELIPGAPGCYALVLSVVADCRLRIGSLGSVTLLPGTYVYAGSAHGPGGLRARVARHLRGGSARHWHIDYLRARATVLAMRLVPHAPPEIECLVAASLAKLPGAQRARRFGSSDCRCPGHLARLPDSRAILSSCV